MNISEEGLNNLESGYETSAFLSDTYLENASYLRVDDLTLSYTFTCKKMKTPGQLKIYASAGNLFTVTDYTGYDPAGESDGVDYFDVYPLARTYTLGIRFNF
jgi:iron complex outermembrane receptor protein